MDITDIARTCTDEEWRNLSPKIHQQIRDARAAKRDPDANTKKRNVAAVAVAEGSVMDATAEPEETAPATNGSGFGSGAYKRANRAAQSN